MPRAAMALSMRVRSRGSVSPEPTQAPPAVALRRVPTLALSSCSVPMVFKSESLRQSTRLPTLLRPLSKKRPMPSLWPSKAF